MIPAADSNLVGRPSADIPGAVLKDVDFTYPGRPQLLRGMCLTLHAGRVTAVLGRSGSGKTTLLKLLGGLLRPERGSVAWLDRAGVKEPPAAYIPQHLGLVRRRSALQNVLVGALARTPSLLALLDWFPAATAAEAREWLCRMGLADKQDEPVACLSGGERQRVAIARALMMRPRFILADEFVSQLDVVTARGMLQLMLGQARAGTGFVFTTHDVELAGAFADRVLIMREGGIVRDVAADDFDADAALAALEGCGP